MSSNTERWENGMPKFDTLIKGGTIVDGTGSPRFVGDIGIKDGIITDIGAGISGDASSSPNPLSRK